MNFKKYKKDILQILKLYEKNYGNKEFDYYFISNFCKESLELEEDVYIGMLSEMQDNNMIIDGFSIMTNIEGIQYVNILATPPKITPLGLKYIENNSMLGKIKSVAEKLLKWLISSIQR